jgi:hypothetical protein
VPAPPAPQANPHDAFFDAVPREVIAWNPAGAKEKAVALGVNSSPTSAAIREQLKLPRGVGLVVESVEKDSPAEAAGVKRHDILEKLDDQILVNPQQMNALVRAKKAGDEVTLSLLRQGERTTVKAKLAEMNVAVNGDVGTAIMLAGNGLVLNRPVPMAGNFPNPAAADEMNAAMNGVWTARVAGAPPMPAKMFVQNINGKQTTQWSDADHDLTLERENGKTMRLKAVERGTGKVLFEGAVDTDEQRKAIPPELLKKVESAEASAAPAPFIRGRGGFGGGGGGGGAGGAAGGFGGGFGGGGVTVAPVGAPGTAARGKVLQWQDDNALLMMRMLGKTPTYLMALSKKDGHVIYDGPVQTDEQRKSLPPEVADQFEMLVNKPDLAKEFGTADAGGNERPK